MAGQPGNGTRTVAGVEVTRLGRFDYVSEPDSPTAEMLAQMTEVVDEYIAGCIRDGRVAELRASGFTQTADALAALSPAHDLAKYLAEGA
jgi:hypothetical protein